MRQMSSFGLGANFNDPQSDDPTSAPAMPQVPSQAVNPLQRLLSGKQKPKQVKASPQLVAAIARARKARPSSEKFG